MKKLSGLYLAVCLLAACGGNADHTVGQPSPASGEMAKPASAASASSTDNQASAALPASDAATQSVLEPTKEQNQMAENYCYAVHAVGNCEGLVMRMDTSDKIEQMLGDPDLGGPQSPYSDACLSGLVKAQEDKQLCRNAWQDFGCGGKKTANLIQESPFGKTDPVLCTFNG